MIVLVYVLPVIIVLLGFIGRHENYSKTNRKYKFKPSVFRLGVCLALALVTYTGFNYVAYRQVLSRYNKLDELGKVEDTGTYVRFIDKNLSQLEMPISKFLKKPEGFEILRQYCLTDECLDFADYLKGATDDYIDGAVFTGYANDENIRSKVREHFFGRTSLGTFISNKSIDFPVVGMFKQNRFNTTMDTDISNLVTPEEAEALQKENDLVENEGGN